MSISPVQHSCTMNTETVARRTEQQKAIELYFDVLLPAAMAECRAADQQSISLPPAHPNRFSRSISAIRARTRTGTPNLLAGLRSPSKSYNTRNVTKWCDFQHITSHLPMQSNSTKRAAVGATAASETDVFLVPNDSPGGGNFYSGWLRSVKIQANSQQRELALHLSFINTNVRYYAPLPNRAMIIAKSTQPCWKYRHLAIAD